MKKQKHRKPLQQGDVCFIPLAEMPNGKRTVLARGRCVVAHGESGHSHIIEDDDEAELIQIGERILLALTKTAPAKHEEHRAFNLAPGIWEIGRVKEYDYLSQMTRQVMD